MTVVSKYDYTELKTALLNVPNSHLFYERPPTDLLGEALALILGYEASESDRRLQGTYNRKTGQKRGILSFLVKAGPRSSKISLGFGRPSR